jgi:hypothetical protein
MNHTTSCAALALLAMLAGCATGTVGSATGDTPGYDARFGDAVRQARSAMTIDPQAGTVPDPVAGMDGQAARAAIARYQDSFKLPPPVVNVINAGGPAVR